MFFNSLRVILLCTICVSAFVSVAAASVLRLGAVVPSSISNDSDLILESIRYGIDYIHNLSLIAPHTLELHEQTISSQPTFALEPYAQMSSFISNMPLHCAIDATQDGLPRPFFANASTPFVSTNALSSTSSLSYEIKPFLNSSVWANAAAALLTRFQWSDICVAFSVTEGSSGIIEVESKFERVWTAQAGRSIVVSASFDSNSTALAAADECAAFGKRGLLLISDARMAHMFISEMWGRRQHLIETIWVDPTSYETNVPFESLNPRLETLARGHGFFAIHANTRNVTLSQMLNSNLRQRFGAGVVASSNAEAAFDSVLSFANNFAAMRDAGEDITNPNLFMQRFVSSRNNFEGIAGLYTFGSDARRDGFLSVQNWNASAALRPRSSGFYDLWRFSRTHGLHNVVGGSIVTTAAASLTFVDGTATVPTGNTPPALNLVLAYPAKRTLFDQWKYAAELAVRHAVEDSLLPGYRINVIELDTLSDESVALSGSLSILGSLNPHVFIGAAADAVTVAMQYVLKGARVPQIGPVASIEQLSDRTQNPMFMRPVSSDFDEAQSILQVLKKYDWNNIAIITSSDSVGLSASDALDRALAGSSIQILARAVVVQPSTDEVVRNQILAIRRANARVIVCITGAAAYPQIIRIAREQRLTTADNAWILGKEARDLESVSGGDLSLLMEGMFTYERFEGSGPVFERFERGMKALPESLYPDTAARFDLLPGVAYVYDSFQTAIRGAALQIADGRLPSNGTNLYEHMNRVNFTGATGRVKYSSGERLFGSVRILHRTNLRTWRPFATVARVSTTNTTAMYDMQVEVEPVFMGGRRTPPQDLVLLFVEWNSAEGVIMCLLASILLVGVLASAVVVVLYKDNILLRASSPMFLLLILAGIAIALLSVFVYTGAPNTAKCHLQLWFFFYGFALSYGSVIIKNFRLWRLWSLATMKIIRITNLHLIGYMQVFFIPFTLMLLLYSAADPPRPRLAGFGLICITNFGVWYLVILACIILMLGFGIFLAVKVRKLPQLFNEARYLGLSTYNLAICLILGLLLFVLLAGSSVTAAYTVLMLTVIIAYGGMWAIIFGPKFYIIFITPERLKELESGGPAPSGGKKEGRGTKDKKTKSSRRRNESHKSRDGHTSMDVNVTHTLSLASTSTSSESDSDSEKSTSSQSEEEKATKMSTKKSKSAKNSVQVETDVSSESSDESSSE